MSIVWEESIRKETLVAIARRMLIAARTAPKGRGEDTMALALVEEKQINRIAARLKQMGEELAVPAFVRDAENILSAPVMILLGTRIKPLGLKKCGMCGFSGCDEKNKHPRIPCVFNTGDLGIAIGSAVSVAMDHRVDNRIMYTVGQAVIAMKLLGPDIKVAYGIPLSATSKNPFFDRK